MRGKCPARWGTHSAIVAENRNTSELPKHPHENYFEKPRTCHHAGHGGRVKVVQHARRALDLDTLPHLPR